MARKTLLTEAEIRQFMKLANLGPLGTRRIDELGFNPDLEGQDEEAIDDLEMDATLDADALGDEEAVDDLDAAAEDGVGEADVEELVQALADTIQQVTGVEVSVEGDAAAELGDEEAVDDIEVDALGGMPGEEIAVDAEEEEVMGMRDVYEEAASTDDIVNEVARRVVARLNQKRQQANMADALAERILNRITSTK
jgi:hypothetical protein